MRTACPPLGGALPAVMRRSLLTAGFLLGFGLLALVFAGSAHADQDDRSTGTSRGLLGGIVEPLAPVVSGVAEAVAPVAEPVTGVVEPVTAPLLRPVTEPLEPVLRVLEPVTRPLLGPAEPLVAPVARSVGVAPGALGAEPVAVKPIGVEPVEPAPGVGPAGQARFPAMRLEQPSIVEPHFVPITVPVVTAAQGPKWTFAAADSAVISRVDVKSDVEPYWAPAGRPGSPDHDRSVAVGTVGTTASGGSGGSPGQADVPGGREFRSSDAGRVVRAERLLLRPWCYVFGRHHPS